MREITTIYVAGIVTGMIVFGGISFYYDMKTRESQKRLIKTAIQTSSRVSCLDTRVETALYFLDQRKTLPNCDNISNNITDRMIK